MPMSKTVTLLLCSVLCCAAQAEDGTFQTRALTPETAWAAAHAALADCRNKGFQVSVAVVDRAGLTQVLLRDRLAGAHTLEDAGDKAWTAASFRMATRDLAEQTQAGKPMSGLRFTPHVMAVAGGLPIEAGGVSLGAIGVSGAPGGDADAGCAQAALKAIADAIEF